MRARPLLVIPALVCAFACGEPRGDDEDLHTSGLDADPGEDVATSGTSTNGDATTNDDDDDGVDGAKFDIGWQPEGCVNLECDQIECDDPGLTTTISGTVYDPSAQLPLYNVQVYIPNAPVDPIVDELVCDQCNAELAGSPLVSAITDTEGKFVLENAPVGENIPLVMQVGKWRRQVTIPQVSACTDNALTDPDLTRLPRSKAEGDLPRIALTTGKCDPLFCLLRRLGIADEEFGVQGSDARIHFYHGVNGSSAFDAGFGASPGASYAEAATLWSGGWDDYDIVMMSCECGEHPEAKDGHRVRLRDYVDLGGRVFATHYHYNWMQGDAPIDLHSVASFWPGLASGGSATADIDTTFPKGQALADWMLFVGGSTVHGELPVVELRAHTASLSAVAQRWLSWNHQNADRTLSFSFNAPIDAPEHEQCGRMVFSDMHVSAQAGGASSPFPSACHDTPLTPQEKVLIFQLFDLSACIIPDRQPPAG